MHRCDNNYYYGRRRRRFEPVVLFTPRARLAMIYPSVRAIIVRRKLNVTMKKIMKLFRVRRRHIIHTHNNPSINVRLYGSLPSSHVYVLRPNNK